MTHHMFLAHHVSWVITLEHTLHVLHVIYLLNKKDAIKKGYFHVTYFIQNEFKICSIINF